MRIAATGAINIAIPPPEIDTKYLICNKPAILTNMLFSNMLSFTHTLPEALCQT